MPIFFSMVANPVEYIDIRHLQLVQLVGVQFVCQRLRLIAIVFLYLFVQGILLELPVSFKFLFKPKLRYYIVFLIWFIFLVSWFFAIISLWRMFIKILRTKFELIIIFGIFFAHDYQLTGYVVIKTGLRSITQPTV